ncbi:MAG: hypothetical protein NUV75_00475 [Gallionella sp.]|nr:hypothetical protein [Gallionella sp.]
MRSIGCIGISDDIEFQQQKGNGYVFQATGNQGTISLIVSRSIPLKQREGTPPVGPTNITRKLIRPLPPPPKTGYQAEPGITDEDYKHILSVIRHEGRTACSPNASCASRHASGLTDAANGHALCSSSAGAAGGAGGGYASYNASNGDHFVNPELRYSFTGKVWGAAGANLFGGKPWGQFGQLARDGNVYLQARYEF